MLQININPENVEPVNGAVDCDPGDEDSVAAIDAVPLPDVETQSLAWTFHDLDKTCRSIRVLNWKHR